jgi:sialic acid synthase SpsE
MRSAVYTVRDMEPGMVINAADLILKSPEDGLSGWEYDNLLFKTVREPIKKEEPLNWGMFEGGL